MFRFQEENYRSHLRYEIYTLSKKSVVVTKDNKYTVIHDMYNDNVDTFHQ